MKPSEGLRLPLPADRSGESPQESRSCFDKNAAARSKHPRDASDVPTAHVHVLSRSRIGDAWPYSLRISMGPLLTCRAPSFTSKLKRTLMSPLRWTLVSV